MQEGPEGAKRFVPTMGGRDVQSDPMEPGLGGRVRSPARPRSVCPHERFLRALLGRLPISEDPEKRPENPIVAVPVEAVEILRRPGTVGGIYHVPQSPRYCALRGDGTVEIPQAARAAYAGERRLGAIQVGPAAAAKPSRSAALLSSVCR